VDGPDAPAGDDWRRRRTALAALAAGASVLALGTWLRLVHLGTPSLWWDELVQVRTVDRPIAELLPAVKWGASPIAGNAGAMPLDYVLLHAWLRSTPAPSPDDLERHLRAPSCAWSVLAVAAQGLVGARLFGRAGGLLAALLLATSLPAILYAAEARPYSLMTLGSLLALAAFLAFERRPGSRRARAALLVADLAWVFTGVLAAFAVGAQCAVLALRALLQSAAARRAWVPLAIGTATAAATLLWFRGIALDARFTRTVFVTPWSVTRDSLWFLSGGSRALLAAWFAAVPFAVLAERRRGGSGAASVAMAASFLALPATALLVARKGYYFHGRHALFLLPYLLMLLAGGSLEVLRRLDPLRRGSRRVLGSTTDGRAGPTAGRVAQAIELAVGFALVALVTGPVMRAFVVAPDFFFARTKTLRDTRAIARLAQDAVGGLAPGESLLVVVERDSPANAVLEAYVDGYGLADRVLLRSPGIAMSRVEEVLRSSGGDPGPLALRPAVGLVAPIRRLLGLHERQGRVPARVGPVLVASYAQPLAGPSIRRTTGVSLGLLPAPGR
jgi:hypothetical protein